jgi:sentrin-specific protease 7
MLMNILWTDLGVKFRKTLPRNDANLCDANKVQSDSLPSTSVDSIETCQKLEPLHQSLNLSEKYPNWICCPQAMEGVWTIAVCYKELSIL